MLEKSKTELTRVPSAPSTRILLFEGEKKACGSGWFIFDSTQEKEQEDTYESCNNMVYARSIIFLLVVCQHIEPGHKIKTHTCM